MKHTWRTLALLAWLMLCVMVAAVLTEAQEQDRTLFVLNQSGDHVAVWIDGRRVGTATAGGSCFRFPSTAGRPRVVFDPVGGDPVRVPWEIPLEMYSWVIVLTPYGLRMNVQQMQTVGSPCDRRKS